ncbi:MAG TPA: anthranilate phosphoribosyltransferase [Candidatus Limnocylindrales bacterium]
MSEHVRAAIAQVMRGGSLSADEAHAAMAQVMEGEATPAQLAGLLLALRMRGEKVDELTGFARAMRERVVAIHAPEGAIDTCGTGGDGSKTFNISTASALVVAATGVPVAKHGNRAMSSATGSADVLEALGIPIDLTPEQASRALATDGFAFLFAPSYHPAMKHAGPVRRELGVPTAFNLLGPMTNPAGVRRQVIGVADPTVAAKVAHVLHHLGTERAFVVHGDGVDELPLDGTGVAYDVSAGGVRKRRIDSSALGLEAAPSSDLRGGDAALNASIIESILRGETGPRRDVVLLNAGAALLVAGRVPTLRHGVHLAATTIDGGRARAHLARLRQPRAMPSVESAA